MPGWRGALQRFLAPGLVVAALALAILILVRSARNPQTDDAIVMADIIDVVPQVSGTISELRVSDNQTVAQGEVLFVIDPRPYEFAVARARAQVTSLDGEIDVTDRRIQGQVFAVEAARAAVRRAEAQARNAADNLRRVEPLLAGEFVTPEKVDSART